jgi:predicted DNA-binding protein
MAEQKKPRTSGSEFWQGKIKNNLDGCTEEERTQIEAKMGQAFNGKLVLIWLLQGRGIVATDRNVVSAEKAKAEDFITQLTAHLTDLKEKGTKVTADYVKECIEKNIQEAGIKKIVTEAFFKPKEPVFVAPPVVAAVPEFKPNWA